MNTPNPSNISSSQARGIALTVLGLLIFIAILVGGFVHQVSQPRVLTAAELKLNGAWVFDKPRALKAFQLLDHHGQAFTAERLQGQWTLVFFGFTYCPDICPTTMALLGQLMQKLDGLPEAADTRVIMVSVDPARDTVEQLAHMVNTKVSSKGEYDITYERVSPQTPRSQPVTPRFEPADTEVSPGPHQGRTRQTPRSLPRGK